MTADEHRERHPAYWVALDALELGRADALTDRRHAEGSRRQDRLNIRSRDSHLLGARGEFVAAKFYGFPEPVHGLDFGKADLGVDVGVRCRSVWTYELKVAPEDKDFWYVLVSWVPPNLGVLRGIYRGRDAKREKGWLKAHGGFRAAYFIPTDRLYDPIMLETVELATGK